jgi:hypothetical protein
MGPESDSVAAARQRPQAWLPDHKRLGEGTVSAPTGADSGARRNMPVEVGNRVANLIRERLLRNTRREALPGWNRRVFVSRSTVSWKCPRGISR